MISAIELKNSESDEIQKVKLTESIEFIRLLNDKGEPLFRLEPLVDHKKREHIDLSVEDDNEEFVSIRILDGKVHHVRAEDTDSVEYIPHTKYDPAAWAEPELEHVYRLAIPYELKGNPSILVADYRCPVSLKTSGRLAVMAREILIREGCKNVGPAFDDPAIVDAVKRHHAPYVPSYCYDKQSDSLRA